MSEVGGRPLGPTATVVATRALESGQTEMEADGQTAVKARAVTAADGRRYVLVATMPIGLLRLLYDAPSAQLLRLLAVLLTAAVACYGLARYVARPLATLRAATHELAQGNLAVRVAPGMGSRTDEFADLGRDFDAMAERLQGLMTSERRLLRDISHELRSPLARLSVALGPPPAPHRRLGGARPHRARSDHALIGQLARLESGAARIGPGDRRGAGDRARPRMPTSRRAAAACGADRRGRRRLGRGDAELLRSAVENVVARSVTPRTAPRSRSWCAGCTTTAPGRADLSP